MGDTGAYLYANRMIFREGITGSRDYAKGVAFCQANEIERMKGK